MKNIRALCLTLFFLLLIAPLFAKGGVMSGAGKLSVIRTAYFDIVYPAECEYEAEKIARVADGYYEEIAALFETDCKIRFPVSITRSVEATNGYFTALPYNAIVLQTISPEISLDQNSVSLTSVFYHELTHAVSTNRRNGFSRFVSAVFGEWFAPAGFLQTNFMHEGTAVSFESLKGEGRVYDPYSRQMVVQTKRDGRFPDWRDVTGARDTFPGGTDAYAFGAQFCHYLQETYGMEKYAEFWRTTGSIHGFKSSIKKTYGKPIAEIWKDFEAWVTVPPSTPAISSEHGTGDFFVSEGWEQAKKNGFSKTNSRRSVFKCIDTAKDSVVWFESKTGGVWYADLSDGTAQKPKKLFTCPSVSRLSLSDDGAWLLVSYLHAGKTTKASLALYDMRRKKLFSLPVKSVRDAGFVRDADGSLQFACVNISRPQLSVDFYTVSEKGTDCVLKKQIVFSEGELPYNPCAANAGGFACIVKKGMDWHIRLYENDTTYHEYGTQKTILHNLHTSRASDGRLALSFSYAQFGETGLPRAGLLYVSQENGGSELVLQDDEVSGSVLDAALLDGAGERLLYVAAFYDTQRLMVMDFASRSLIRHKGDTPLETVAADSAGGLKEPSGQSSINAEHSQTDAYSHISYNPFRYYRHTARIPIGLATSYKRDTLDLYSFGYMNPGSAFVGASIASSTPWQDAMVVLSGGWNPFNRNGGAYLSLSGGNGTFSYSANSNLFFDGYGFMQTTEGLSLSKTLYNRFGKSFKTGAEGIYFYGHSSHGIKDGWSARARGYAQFSTVHKMSPRYADSGGVTFQPFILWERITDHYVNLGATLGARIPGLFPISLSATLFPSTKYAASGSATVYLFSWEVQKGIPVALYLDRLYLSATYTGKIRYQAEQYFDIWRTAQILRDVQRSDYSDTVQLKLGAVASVNAGVLSRFSFDAGVIVQYRPNPLSDEEKISMGVNAVLVY
ncbi:MAG: hypothetical protein IJS09_04220 [Treponema sp.]|nr:hypothetical protein [Treponema sp.]